MPRNRKYHYPVFRLEKIVSLSFKNRTVLITGATRGFGKAIAIKLAKEGANIIIAAKSITEDPRLGGTIYSAAAEVEAAGGKCLAVQVDIRFEDQIEAAIAKAAETFGGIDVVINNASAIQLTGTEQTESKKFDLIHSINVRGTFLVVKHALPYLKKGNNPHILTLSPPINMDPRWLGPHVAYTISKFNMSMLAIGWAQEFKSAGIASNAIWPKTTIDTAAVRNLLGGQALANMSRTTDIMADAAYYILKQKATDCTGNTFTDEEVLAKEGITNLDHYAVVPGGKLFNDLFV